MARGSEFGEIVLDHESLARELDRGLHQLGEREPAGAEAAVRKRKPRHRAGHADRERAVARLAGIGIALLVQEHVAGGRLGRGLAVVDGDIARAPLAAAEVDHHVAATADISRARIGDRQCKAGGDSGVDRVAAALQHRDPDAGRARLLRHHHAVARFNRPLRQRGRGRNQSDPGEDNQQDFDCGHLVF